MYERLALRLAHLDRDRFGRAMFAAGIISSMIAAILYVCVAYVVLR